MLYAVEGLMGSLVAGTSVAMEEGVVAYATGKSERVSGLRSHTCDRTVKLGEGALHT